MGHDSYAGDITPQKAWELLAAEPRAILVDVRTPAEWTYVGVPDLNDIGKRVLFVPWVLFPAMEANPKFVESIESGGIEHDAPLLFLCRSGVRSRAAAAAMTSRGYRSCFNVASGFEGDPDSQRHRGSVSGWKAEGLPWVQG